MFFFFKYPVCPFKSRKVGGASWGNRCLLIGMMSLFQNHLEKPAWLSARYTHYSCSWPDHRCQTDRRCKYTDTIKLYKELLLSAWGFVLQFYVNCMPESCSWQVRLQRFKHLVASFRLFYLLRGNSRGFCSCWSTILLALAVYGSHQRLTVRLFPWSCDPVNFLTSSLSPHRLI